MLLAGTGAEAVPRPNTGSNVEVDKLKAFNEIAVKVSEFITICKLFLRIRMRNTTVEEQIQ